MGIPLAACLFLSCHGLRQTPNKAYNFYRNVVVLPVSNQTNDLTAPILVRYFLEKELKGKGFTLARSAGDVDDLLREMGAQDAGPSNLSAIQQVGQSFGTGAVMCASLLKYSRDLNGDHMSVQAHFQLIDTQSGQTLWTNDVDYQGSGRENVPIRTMVTTDFPPDMVRSIAKGPAGKLPRKIVDQGLKTLHAADLKNLIQKRGY